jgi:hypothetical protein
MFFVASNFKNASELLFASTSLLRVLNQRWTCWQINTFEKSCCTLWIFMLDPRFVFVQSEVLPKMDVSGMWRWVVWSKDSPKRRCFCQVNSVTSHKISLFRVTAGRPWNFTRKYFSCDILVQRRCLKTSFCVSFHNICFVIFIYLHNMIYVICQNPQWHSPKMEACYFEHLRFCVRKYVFGGLE